MAAQAALKFDASAATSELYRSQRQKKYRTKPRRGQVLRFPTRNASTPAPTQAGIVPEARLNTALGTAEDRLATPNPETVPPTPVPSNNNAFFDQIEANRQRTQQESFLRDQNQRRIQTATSQPLPLDVLSIGDRIPAEHQQEALNVIDRHVDAIERLADKLGQGDAFRKQKQAVVEEAKKELGKLAKKGIKKGVEFFYRLVGDAAPADVGELAYIELIVGSMVNAFRLFLTVMAVKKRGIKGSFAKYATEALGEQQAGKLGLKAPDEKKGIIRELFPGEMDLTDPSVWVVDIPVALLGWFILFVIVGIAHILLGYVAIFVGANIIILDSIAGFLGY